MRALLRGTLGFTEDLTANTRKTPHFWVGLAPLNGYVDYKIRSALTLRPFLEALKCERYTLPPGRSGYKTGEDQCSCDNGIRSSKENCDVKTK